MVTAYRGKTIDPVAAINASRWAWLMPTLLLRPVGRPQGGRDTDEPATVDSSVAGPRGSDDAPALGKGGARPEEPEES